MKNKLYVKLALDIIMFINFLLLMKIGFGGLSFHEVSGLGIGFVILFHILCNFQWVKRVTQRLLDKTLHGKTRLGYLINAILLILMVLIVVSGIFNSKLIFPNVSVGNPRIWKEIHELSSYLSLAFLGVHIGLHWNWIVAYTKNIFKA